MAKFGDWTAWQEGRDIVDRLLERFPAIFDGFNANEVYFVMNKTKRSKEPIKVHISGHPFHLFTKPYAFECFDLWWKDMDAKKKNLAIWRAMCAVPDKGFDDQSKDFGKKLQPEIKMFLKEYAACGGVPNWLENPAAKDPMERTADEVSEDVPKVEAVPGQSIKRTPVTAGDIEEA
jgi:hypothetical protein